MNRQYQYQQQQQPQQPQQQGYMQQGPPVNQNQWQQNQQQQPQQNRTEPKKEYENLQIIRIDGRNVFVEVMRSGFSMDKGGKVVLNFISYDDRRVQGDRIKDQISVFIDIPEFIQMAQDLKSGRLAEMSRRSREIAKEKDFAFPKEIIRILGGTSAATLQKQGKARADGKPISRQFKISPGVKYPWMLSAEIGPGERTQTGLIAPKYNKGRPEKVIRVPMSNEHFKQLFLMTEMYIQGYITAKFVNDDFGKS